MDSMRALEMGILNRGKPGRVFDWEKAANLIVKIKPFTAYAGLDGDWEATFGLIWEDGRPVPNDGGTYLASTWATPQIEIDGDRIDCWRMMQDTPGWDEKTFWPDEAIAIVVACDDFDFQPKR